MKKLPLIFVFLFLCTGWVAAQNKVKVTGTIKGVTEATPVLLITNNSLVDSARVINGKFALEAIPGNGGVFTLFLPEYQSKGLSAVLELYLEPGEVVIQPSGPMLEGPQISGSDFAVQYGEFLNDETIKASDMAIRELDKEYRQNPAALESIRQRAVVVMKNRTNAGRKWIAKHPKSVISLYNVHSLVMAGEMASSEALGIMKQMPAHFAQNTLYRITQQVAATKGITEVGAEAPLFSQADVSGKMLNLKDLRGKYLLVDFWASWCGPCRRENPNIVKAYDRFKGKNFQILGVSLDNSKEAWLNAIKKDLLTWPQVSDLGGWKNAVAVQYGVSSIPFNVLLNPQGKIVARNLTGEALETKLAEILGKN